MANGHGGARRGAGRKPLGQGSTALQPLRPNRPPRLDALPDAESMPEGWKLATTWRDDFKLLLMEHEAPILREILTTGTRAERFQALAYLRGYISGSIPRGADPKKEQQAQDVGQLLFQQIVDRKQLESKLEDAENKLKRLEGAPDAATETPQQ